MLNNAFEIRESLMKPIHLCRENKLYVVIPLARPCIYPCSQFRTASANYFGQLAAIFDVKPLGSMSTRI